MLQAVDGSTKLEVEDAEPDMRGERLELLAVVRGLEALEQPSRVTLVTASRYVSRGLTCSLPEWRESGWQWEHHGQMVPIKNRDLWQRLDRALRFHRVQCRSWRFDAAGPITRSASASRLTERERDTIHRAGQRSSLHVSALESPLRAKTSRRRFALGTARNRRRWLLTCRRHISDFFQGVRLRLAQCGTSLLLTPWLE